MNNMGNIGISQENIGLEVEVPFRFYYPHLYEKYLSGKGYIGLTRAEEKAFSKDIKEEEEGYMLARLEKTSKELGLSRGVDRYREFVYPATKELDKHIVITQRLIAENLMPDNIPLSTHITIGNISKNHAYAMLVLLEQQFLTKKRLAEALKNNGGFKGGWGKGHGGIVHKKGKQLEYGDACAHELRTLKISMNQLPECLSLCKKLLSIDEKEVVITAKNRITGLGLQWGKWTKKDIITYLEKGNFLE